MGLLHLFDVGLELFFVEFKKSSVIEMVTIFKHDGGDQYQTNIEQVYFIPIAIINTGEAIFMHESYFLGR